MQCSECKKRPSCKELCESVEIELRKRCNGKSTYKNKEVSISEVTVKESSFDSYLQRNERTKRNGYIKNTTISHEVWMDIMNIIETKLTDKQKENTISYLDGNSAASIGRQNGTSGRAVRYSIFGHPKQGGGVVRKIQAALEILHK